MKLRSIGLVLLLTASTNSFAARYDQVLERVKLAAAANPRSTELFELKKDDGESLWGIRIGSGPVEDLVVATHHGNEYGSTEVAVALIEDLAMRPLGDRTTYVIPVINISGFNANQRQEKGYDPNRDWPGPCGNAHGTPLQLASIRAIDEFIASKKFVMGITLHTYAETVTYPWSFKDDSPTAHDHEFREIAEQAAKVNGYRTGKTPDLIYTTLGDFESYAFWKHGIWSFLFEMGTSHSPDAAAVERLKQKNVPAIRAMLETAPTTNARDHKFSGSCADAFSRSLMTDRGDE